MPSYEPESIEQRLGRLTELLGESGPPGEEQLEEARHLLRGLTDNVERMARRTRVYQDTIYRRNRDYERKILEMSILRQVGHMIAGSLFGDELLDDILGVLVRELNVDTAAVLLIDRASGDLRIEALHDRSTGNEAAEAGFNDGVAGWVVAANEPMIVDDVTRDVRFASDGESIGSLVCVPLQVDEQVLGALRLTTCVSHAFRESDLRILTIVASQIAGAVAGRSLHREIRSFKDRLEDEVTQRTQELEERTRDLRRKNDQVTELYFSLEKAQRELEDRNRELVRALTFNDNVVETINVGICVVEGEGKIVTWNRALEAITGGQLPKDRVLGRRLDEIPAKLREDFALGRTLLDAQRIGRPVHRHGHLVDLPTGRTLHLNVHHLPVSMTSTDTLQVITVIEDVTDNIELHGQQVKAERLAAINETMVSVNHEVNNPLAVILGYAQMRLRRLPDVGQVDEWVDPIRRDLERIEREAMRIREITKKLSTLVEPVVTSYPGSGDVKMVDLERSRFGSPNLGNRPTDGG